MAHHAVQGLTNNIISATQDDSNWIIQNTQSNPVLSYLGLAGSYIIKGVGGLATLTTSALGSALGGGLEAAGQWLYGTGQEMANDGQWLGQVSQTYGVYGSYQPVQVSPGSTVTVPSNYVTTYSGNPGGQTIWVVTPTSNSITQDLLKPGNLYPVPQPIIMPW
ncbi:hypothetical protein [Vulcanisaeta sp. JCM 16159]|uniref:hypothetical protein n=1 Tax=Vulcanisaeta sp. JCM 16159 TaxID=1295371 RepID=UPI001FB5667B|nr:hypothetical protein [Vulcanisaeta sp. JCM 16159]